jgi:hypothetical protein
MSYPKQMYFIGSCLFAATQSRRVLVNFLFPEGTTENPYVVTCVWTLRLVCADGLLLLLFCRCAAPCFYFVISLRCYFFKVAPLRCATGLRRKELFFCSFYPALTPSARERASGRAGLTWRRA